jgi:hypothetical protein
LADRLVELGYLDEVSHVTVREWLKKTVVAYSAYKPRRDNG